MKINMSPKQTEAVTAVLTSPTLTEAAEKAGVSLRTLQRWNKEPEFQQALHEAETLVFHENAKKIISLHGVAIDSLMDVLSQPSQEGASNKIRAARAIIDLANRYHEISETEKRLTRLEELNKYEV